MNSRDIFAFLFSFSNILQIYYSDKKSSFKKFEQKRSIINSFSFFLTLSSMGDSTDQKQKDSEIGGSTKYLDFLKRLEGTGSLL